MKFFIPSTRSWETLAQLLIRIQQQGSRVVVFGEQHQHPQILLAQNALLQALKPHYLVMEMFNFRQQERLLDNFARYQINLPELQSAYDTEPEGFDILHHYGQLLESARLQNTRTIAGFVPRSWAARMAREPESQVLQALLDENSTLYQPMVNLYRSKPGTKLHYDHFLKLVGAEGDSEKWQRFFRAQVLKDASMASKVNQLLQFKIDNPDNQRVFQMREPPMRCMVYAICGSGHSDFGFGVPERLVSTPFVISVASESESQLINIDQVADAVFVFTDEGVH